MYTLSSKKDYVNPYRHGVNIGNFVEDLIGKDLVHKHNQTPLDIKMYVSETREKYSSPSKIFNRNIKAESNRKPNFDLNIDFSRKTMKDINEQIEQNIINNNNRLLYLSKTSNKNNFGNNSNTSNIRGSGNNVGNIGNNISTNNTDNNSLYSNNKNINSNNISTEEQSQINELNKDNKMEDFLCNTQRSNILSKYSDYPIKVQDQIGKQTNGFIKKDLIGLYFTTKSGLANNLLKGHGPRQQEFEKTEHISVKK